MTGDNKSFDFLGQLLTSYKCSRCKKTIQRMAMDKESSKTCPACTNKDKS